MNYTFNVQTFNTPVSGLFHLVSRMYLQHAHVYASGGEKKNRQQDDVMTRIRAFCITVSLLHYSIIIYSRVRRGPKSLTNTRTHSHSPLVYVSMWVGRSHPPLKLWVPREMSRDRSGARTHGQIFIVALLWRSWIPKRVFGIVLPNWEGGSRVGRRYRSILRRRVKCDKE